MKKTLILSLAIVMLFSLTACGGNTEADSEPIESTQTSAEEETVFEPVSLGDFSAQDFDGNSVTKDIFSEYDLTMVNLWTTTCSYCIAEMPILNELITEIQEEGKSFNIISICMDIGSTKEVNEANLTTAKEIIKKSGVSYPCLIPDSVLLEGRLKGSQAFPESFFVDSEGNVVSEPYLGALSKNHWRVTMNNEIEKADKE